MFHKRPLDTIRHQLPIRHVSFKSRKQYRTDTGKIGSKALAQGFPAWLLVGRGLLTRWAWAPLGDPARLLSCPKPRPPGALWVRLRRCCLQLGHRPRATPASDEEEGVTG